MNALGRPPTSTTAGAPALPPLQPGTLYLVATPIGNLEDITLRALRVLRECSVVAAEDTRHTGQLLRGLQLRKPMVSCHHFNEARRSAQLIERLRRGETVALVTDSGSPGISDPGERVVRAVLEAGCRVEPVPGPCALVAALTSSGLATGEFHFCGFLPQKPGQRAKTLDRLLALPGTLALYESPYRVERLLGELAQRVPARGVVIARELTKRFEEFLRGRPDELLARLSGRRLKGECVVLVQSADDTLPAPPHGASAPEPGPSEPAGAADPRGLAIPAAVREEIFDVVDEADGVVGAEPRSTVHREGLRHRAVHVLVFNARGELFLQKRSFLKDCFPGTWDSSASGHLDRGEAYDACALRELKEELGIAAGTPPRRLFKVDACAETGEEFCWVYRCEHEGPFQLQPEELDTGGWFAPETVDRWVSQRAEEFAPAFLLIWQRFRTELLNPEA